MDRNSRIQWPNTSLAPTLTAFPKYRGQNNLTSLIGSISETANYICPFKTGCLQRRIARFEMWWTPCFEVMLLYTLVLYDGGDRAFLACRAVRGGRGAAKDRVCRLFPRSAFFNLLLHWKNTWNNFQATRNPIIQITVSIMVFPQSRSLAESRLKNPDLGEVGLSCST